MYAFVWTDAGIYIYFWKRGSFPGNIKAGKPVQNKTWGRPMSFLSPANCNIGTYFKVRTFLRDRLLHCFDDNRAGAGHGPRHQQRVGR
jgi:hypothetical protein